MIASAKCRKLLLKNNRRITPAVAYQKFKLRESVALIVNSANNKSNFNMRFHGRVGKIIKVLNNHMYHVHLKRINKTLLMSPIELKKVIA